MNTAETNRRTTLQSGPSRIPAFQCFIILSFSFAMCNSLPQAFIEHHLFTAVSTDFCLAVMMLLHRTDCLISSPLYPSVHTSLPLQCLCFVCSHLLLGRKPLVIVVHGYDYNNSGCPRGTVSPSQRRIYGSADMGLACSGSPFASSSWAEVLKAEGEGALVCWGFLEQVQALLSSCRKRQKLKGGEEAVQSMGCVWMCRSSETSWRDE